LTSMRGGQSPAGYLAARGLEWSNAGFDFSSGERWWLPSNSGDPTSAPRWATRTEWAAQFTRAGSSYYVNANGNLALAGTNELRIDYSSGSPRVLLEGASTNLATYSGDTSNAIWALINGVAKTSGQADPLGGTGAAIFSGFPSTEQKFFRNDTSISFTAGVAYTASCFFKASSSGFVQLSFNSVSFGATQYANFSLTGDGSVTATGGTITAQIFKLANGWYRVSITAIATATAVAPGPALVLINNGTQARLVVSTGSLSITAWGSNVVAQDFLSSYINSVASASSRVGDVFRAPTGAENVMLGRNTFGVLARCDGFGQLAGGSNSPYPLTQVGVGGNYMIRTAGTVYPANSFANTSTSPTLFSDPITGNITTPFAVAFTQTTANRRISAKGNTVVSNSTAVNASSRIDIAQFNGGSSPDYRGYKTVAFGPTLLSDAQLVTLSGAV
jgi:hypothetical protein